MSPFRGQLSGKRAPASTYVTVIPQSNPQGCVEVLVCVELAAAAQIAAWVIVVAHAQQMPTATIKSKSVV
jgi:hypothetical protein